MFGLTVY